MLADYSRGADCTCYQQIVAGLEFWAVYTTSIGDELEHNLSMCLSLLPRASDGSSVAYILSVVEAQGSRGPPCDMHLGFTEMSSCHDGVRSLAVQYQGHKIKCVNGVDLNIL